MASRLLRTETERRDLIGRTPPEKALARFNARWERDNPKRGVRGQDVSMSLPPMTPMSPMSPLFSDEKLSKKKGQKVCFIQAYIISWA